PGHSHRLGSTPDPRRLPSRLSGKVRPFSGREPKPQPRLARPRPDRSQPSRPALLLSFQAFASRTPWFRFSVWLRSPRTVRGTRLLRVLSEAVALAGEALTGLSSW